MAAATNQPAFVSYCLQKAERADANYILFWLQDSSNEHTLAMVVSPSGNDATCTFFSVALTTCSCHECRAELQDATKSGSTSLTLISLPTSIVYLFLHYTCQD